MISGNTSLAKHSALAGKRVLITRPIHQSETLIDAITSVGAIPVTLPLIAIVADENTSNETAWRRVHDYDWVVFTSANAVAHAWPHAAEALANHRSIATVGPATAAAVHARGGHVARVATTYVAESLVDALGDVSGTRVLWPRGANVRDVIIPSLRAHGATVDDIVVYHTEPAPLPSDAEERVRTADIITFASPSAIRYFVTAFGTNAVSRVVCIGPITAAAATEAGLNVDCVAAEYTSGGLLTALTTLYAE